MKTNLTRIFLLFFIISLCHSCDDKEKQEKSILKEFIQQLGDRDFNTRENAVMGLASQGVKALKVIHEAENAKDSKLSPQQKQSIAIIKQKIFEEILKNWNFEVDDKDSNHVLKLYKEEYHNFLKQQIFEQSKLASRAIEILVRIHSESNWQTYFNILKDNNVRIPEKYAMLTNLWIRINELKHKIKFIDNDKEVKDNPKKREEKLKKYNEELNAIKKHLQDFKPFNDSNDNSLENERARLLKLIDKELE